MRGHRPDTRSACGTRHWGRGDREGDRYVIEADLVVDAAGRGSRGLNWLEALGYDTPAVEKVGRFSGQVDGGTVQTVKIMGKPAAVVDSQASNTPSHIATPPGTSFQVPPQNKSTIKVGSATVKIGGKQAARNGDMSVDCDDITPTAPKGQVIAAGTVMIG